MDEEKRTRTGDTAGPGTPRKSPRLERPAAATESDSGGGGAALLEGGNPCEELNDPNAASLVADLMDETKRARQGDTAATALDVSDWWEKAAALTLMKFSGDRHIQWCQHVSCGQDDIDLAVTLIRTCDDSPKCSAPECDNTEGKEIAVCLGCESRVCTRHGKQHAQINQHWIALVYERPNVAYCFVCEECYFIRADNFGEEMADDEDVIFVDSHKKGGKIMTFHNEVGDHASTATVAGAGGGAKEELDVSDPWEQAAALVSDGSFQRCPHVLGEQDDIDVAITLIKSCDEAPMCNDYGCGTTEERNIMLCLGCESRLCIEHADSHAWRNQHWVVLMYKRPTVAYCFKCKDFYFINNEEFARRMEDDKDGFFISTHKKGEEVMKVDNEAGGHASGSVIGHACPIKGIPNLGNTCYLNSLVQCLLVLGRLQAWMLGPDAPRGLLSETLSHLFEDAENANNAAGMLNPTKLLSCLRMMDSEFVGTFMQDSHEALCRLRSGLDREERIMKLSNIQGGAPSAVAPTVIDSIFGGQLSVTRSCKRCSFRSFSHDVFHDLSVPLPPKKSPAKNVELPPWAKGHRPQRKIRINLFPAIDKHKSDNEKTRKISERGYSQSPASELEDVVMVKASDPLKVDSTKVEQISQSKDAVHDPLQTQKDKVQGKTIDVLPQKVLYDVKVEGMDAATADSRIPEDLASPPLVSSLREENATIASGSDVEKNDNTVQPEVCTEAKMTTSSVKVATKHKGKARSSDIVYGKAQDVNSLASIEECLELYFEAESIERNCENCSKVAQKPGIILGKYNEPILPSTKEDTIVGDRSEQSEKITFQSEQSSNLNMLEVECTSLSSQTHGSGQHDLASVNMLNKNSECHEGVQEIAPSCAPAEEQAKLLSGQDQNASTQDEAKPDRSARQVDENQNDQKDENGCSTETRLFCKLPPVLTIHLVRSLGPQKVIGHVSFKEVLDVGQFMDPSSEDKGNSSYRLVGVVEHLGRGTDIGHFVAYVRPSHQQHSSGSSSWFRSSDADIREICLEEVLKCEAYLLFYERMEG